MITQNREEIRPAKQEHYFNLEQIYSKMDYGDRIRMQKIKGYALTLVNYIQRNRLFVKHTGGDFFAFADQVFAFALLACSEEEIDCLIWPDIEPEALEGIRNILRYRRVWWDGTNAQKGERGERIPFVARIEPLAERYEELLREQPYKISDGNANVLEQIQKEAGTRFQPELVQAFVNCGSILQKLDIEFGAL